MTNARIDSESHFRRSSSSADDLPVQPSGLPSSSDQAFATSSETATAEPIPSREQPAASPSADNRRELNARAANRFWWPVMLAVVVVGLLALVAAVSDGGDRGVRGPADQAAPDAPAEEKAPPSAR